MYKVVSIGDINIDYVIDAHDTPLSSLDLSGCLFKRIQTFVGGNGVFFAESARQVGFDESFLLGTVGVDHTGSLPDTGAQLAITRLKENGVIPLLSLDGQETGKVIIIYQPMDNRLMFADRGANAGFRLANLTADTRMAVADADLLHVSGYVLLRPEQKDDVKTLTRQALGYGKLTSVDIVPHDLYKTTSFEDLKRDTEFVRAICVEAKTIMGFMKLEQNWAKNRENVLNQLSSIYEFCLIRINNNSDFVIISGKEKFDFCIPYNQDVASLRFTDRVYASALLNYLKNNRTLAQDQNWVDGLVNLIKIK